MSYTFVHVTEHYRPERSTMGTDPGIIQLCLTCQFAYALRNKGCSCACWDQTLLFMSLSTIGPRDSPVTSWDSLSSLPSLVLADLWSCSLVLLALMGGRQALLFLLGPVTRIDARFSLLNTPPEKIFWINVFGSGRSSALPEYPIPIFHP